MKRAIILPITSFAVLLLLAACSVPFTVVTETSTVEIPISTQFGSGYQEDRVLLPAEARREGVRFTDVRFNYTATTDSGLEADVEIWISQDQTTDGTYNELSDDRIVDRRLSRGETVSGLAQSDALVRALNAGQQYVVVGGFAESLLGGGTVTITVFAEIAGSVDFP